MSTSDKRPSNAVPDVAYLDTDAAVAGFLERIRNAKEIAIDTEGASFHRFVDRIYLIQLSTRAAHAIIDPLPVSTPEALGRLLEDPAVEVVFHDADYDLRLLHQDYGWHPTHLFDTRIAAQLLGVPAFGLAALLERNFGVKLDKKHQRADWSMRPLTPGMLDYAAQDTLHLLGLRDALSDELAKKGRLTWAREEFQRLEGTRWEPTDPSDAFLKVKGARDMTRRQLAILRELVQWRDARALQLDRATFRVVANEALLDAARATPDSPSALGAIKGMPKGVVERSASEVLAAIRRGLDVAESQLPKFPRSARWDRDPEFDAKVTALKTIRDAAAKELELDPGVLCSRDRMEAVARRLPRSVEELGEVTELRRWQAEVLGAGFVSALKPFAAKRRERSDSPVGSASVASGADAGSPYRDDS